MPHLTQRYTYAPAALPRAALSPANEVDLLRLFVTACIHARRDMQVIVPIVESGAGMSASIQRNTLGLINKALVALQASQKRPTADDVTQTGGQPTACSETKSISATRGATSNQALHNDSLETEKYLPLAVP